jgi:Protein of unknown function (DUF2911)
MRFVPALALVVLAAAPLSAQSGLRAPLSTRATFSMPLATARVQGQPAPTPKMVTIDYGQPHARGREVPTELSKEGTVWRTGANTSTTLKTEADLVIGGVNVPAGNYSLYTIREGGRTLLIINNNTGQWGTEYAADKDLARVPLRVTNTTDVLESLQITMVPADNQSARGTLNIQWGKLHLSTDWSVR